MVETVLSNLLEVGLCDPRVPVIVKTRIGFRRPECLCVGVFVYNSTSVRPLREDTGCYPGLKNKPD